MPDDLVVVWRVTERCNLECPFCAYDRRLPHARMDADPQQVLVFGALLREEHTETGRTILVSWLGGEPFLWNSLLDVSRTFRHEFGLQTAVTTNGMVLRSKAMRERIVSDFDQITISIDDIGAGHDRLRGAVGLFDNLKTGIIQLADLAAQARSGLLIRINIVLMCKTIHAFESLCAQLADWGVNEVTFNVLGGRDRPEFFPANCLREDDVKWFTAEFPRISQEMTQRGIHLRGGGDYLKRIMMLARGESLLVEDCQPGRTFLFVDEKGMLAPCHFSVDGYGLSTRDLHTASDLHSLPFIFFERKQRNFLSVCRDCRSTQVFGKFNQQVLEGMETS